MTLNQQTSHLTFLMAPPCVSLLWKPLVFPNPRQCSIEACFCYQALLLLRLFVCHPQMCGMTFDVDHSLTFPGRRKPIDATEVTPFFSFFSSHLIFRHRPCSSCSPLVVAQIRGHIRSSRLSSTRYLVHLRQTSLRCPPPLAVDENPTCSVPALKGFEGLWSYAYGHAS